MVATVPDAFRAWPVKFLARFSAFRSFWRSVPGAWAQRAVHLLVLCNADGPGLADGLLAIKGLVRPGVGLHGDEAFEGA